PRSDAGVRPHAPALSETRWRAAHESQVRGRSSLTPRGRYAAPHERAHIHAHLKPHCKGFFRYISALLHCGKTAPRRGSVECSFGCAILGPLRLIFSIGEGAGGTSSGGRRSITPPRGGGGVPKGGARGQTPPRGGCE